MRKVTLTREDTSDDGTFGDLTTDSGYACRSGELPWRDNAVGKSCIPSGIYSVSWRLSPKHGLCYHVDGVPGRTDIEIHAANFMGDASLGLSCDLLGCIATGLTTGVLFGQRGILDSKLALSELISDLALEPFELTIIGIQDAP